MGDDAAPPPRASLAAFLHAPAPVAAETETQAAPATSLADASHASAADVADAGADAPPGNASPETAEAGTPARTQEPPAAAVEAIRPEQTTDAAASVAVSSFEQRRESRPTAAEADAPQFLHPTSSTPARPRTAKWQWMALAALSLLLVVQVLLADRARLAADAQWRPLLMALCGAFGCELPPWREPGAFTMLGRDVRPLAGVAGALQAQATFRNDARWPQPWPTLLLSLSDADGRVVGARAFAPREYLQGADATGELSPGQSTQVVLRLREPETAVVAFAFEFR